jgi:5'-nucleotidase
LGRFARIDENSELTYDRRFHELWTSSVGTPGYIKRFWSELDVRLERATTKSQLDLILREAEFLNKESETGRNMTTNQNPENIALFDLDGTLADFDGGMDAGMRKIATPDEVSAGTYFPREQDNEPDYLKERRRLVKRQPGFWRDLYRLNMGMSLLQSAIETGYRISILTKAPRTNFPAWTEKVEWAWKNLPMEEHSIQICMAEDKGLVYGRMLVDDYPPYVSRWLAWRPRGLVIMPAQAWNKDFEHPQVVRVFDQASMTRAIEAMNSHYVAPVI